MGRAVGRVLRPGLWLALKDAVVGDSIKQLPGDHTIDAESPGLCQSYLTS